MAGGLNGEYDRSSSSSVHVGVVAMACRVSARVVDVALLSISLRSLYMCIVLITSGKQAGRGWRASLMSHSVSTGGGCGVEAPRAGAVQSQVPCGGTR